MASAQEKFVFEGKHLNEIYSAALQAVPLAGLKVWKTRELAGLVLAQGEVAGSEVRCNIAISMVDDSTTISAESDDLPEEQLKPVIHNLKTCLEKVLA